MPRKRHEKKHSLSSVSAQPAQAPDAQSEPPIISRASQKVIKRIADGGVEFLMENFERIMEESQQLAGEPEFSDFKLDEDKLDEISERWYKKYEKRLDKARKESEDAAFDIIGEIESNIIDEMATPRLRTEVMDRLQTMIDRLMPTNQSHNLEMALVLDSMLSMEEIPWSACGLITEIFDRTMESMVQQYENQEEILNAVVETLKESGDETIDIDEILESPEKFIDVGEKVLAARPELAKRLEDQVKEMVGAFEKELVNGKIQLDLFTDAELVFPFNRLQEELGEPNNLNKSAEELQEIVHQALVQAIGVIMTPQRLHRMYKDMEATTKDWMSKKQKWAAALTAELSWFEGDVYEENSFVKSAFLGQVRRLSFEEEPLAKPKKRKH